MISEFQGEYRFLSNFWPCMIDYEGVLWPSVEHAYQAAKTTDGSHRAWILSAETPNLAKRRGKKVNLRTDWSEVRLRIMEELIRQKFKNPVLRQKLLATEDQELIEGNYWGDIYWGKCKGVGQNHLGRIIMKVREEIKCEPLL